MLASFNGPAGRDPLTTWIDLRLAATPTLGDALYAASIAHYNIRSRTERGVDYQGNDFVSYSEKYARRKAKELGHSDTVDLFGYQSHPHMLNSIVFHGAGFEQALNGFSSGFTGDQPIDSFQIGFYGEEADRAQAINDGLGHQRRREFFNLTQDVVHQMEDGVGQLMTARVEEKL